MPKEINLHPVRLVQQSRDYLHKDDRRGGGKVKFFVGESDYESHQKKLISEIGYIHKSLEKKFRKYPDIPLVIKAQLRSEALAKSHRPNKVFDIDTCPIIGLDQMGELLISTTNRGLTKLSNRIKITTNKIQKANITSIKKLKKFEEKDKLLGLNLKDLKKQATRKNKTFLKVILFDHHDLSINKSIENKFINWIKQENLDCQNISNLEGLKIWKIIGANEKQIKQICEHPSVRMLSFFPSFKIIVPKKLILKEKFPKLLKPNKDINYAKVGVIDTGITENHPFLAPWVIDKTSFVPNKYKNCKHGCSVGGLVCMGQQINGANICPDEDLIKIVDVQMIPNQEPNEGPIDTIREDDIIERLQSSLLELSKRNNVKIWNMSAGFEVSTHNERFSSLAIFLDKLQDKYNIIITLPSGNYTNILNQRTWPPQSRIIGDKLQIPGDSVRAITVGALACKEKSDSIVRINQPASYSCRGPGPTFMTKPELVHYSGNLSIQNNSVNITDQGIKSFDDKGNIIENIGTSFSCPLVARTLALLHHNIFPTPSNNMIKALTIHHSYLPQDIGRSEDIFSYVGFGMPTKLDKMLNCQESEITLLFEQEIFEGHILEYPFEWPNSLIDENGNCRGYVKMTLVANVPLDSNYGYEYIRANVSALLQKGVNKNGKIEYKSALSEDPDPSYLNKCYEKELIQHGYKWKPIKRYEKIFYRTKADGWRLRLRVLSRDGIKLGNNPIKFALVFTISDPKGIAPVYNEVIMGLRNQNIITLPIQLRSKISQRLKLTK